MIVKPNEIAMVGAVWAPVAPQKRPGGAQLVPHTRRGRAASGAPTLAGRDRYNPDASSKIGLGHVGRLQQAMKQLSGA